jgi:hypothetical protein
LQNSPDDDLNTGKKEKLEREIAERKELVVELEKELDEEISESLTTYDGLTGDRSHDDFLHAIVERLASEE